MRIIVLVKQVPTITDVKFNPETKTIVREGVNLILNSLDRRALTQAIKLKEKHGGDVTALTMGPPQARTVLTEALATGADRAVHLVDPAFAGADTLATARALAAALGRLDFDLVLCGRFSIDAETGQVGPEVAELLGIPQATNLRRLESTEDGMTLLVDREVDDGTEQLEIQLPCLASAGEFLITPIRPTPEQLEAAKALPVETWTAADLGLPLDQVGAAGSPTSVSEIRELALPREKRILSGKEPAALAQQVVEYLLSRGLFTPWQQATAQVPPSSQASGKRSDRAVWVVAELVHGRPRNVTLELMGRGAELAAQLNGELGVVLLGNNLAGQTATLASYGADRVFLADHSSLAHYSTQSYATVLADAITRHHPYLVLIPSTVNGRDLAPRVAARLGLGLTGDCIGVELDERQRVVQLKPAFGGNIVAPIISRTTPAVATVRPGVLAPLQPQEERAAAIERLPDPPGADGRVKLLQFQEVAGATGMHMDGAEALVGVGAGVGSPEGLTLCQELAKALDGAISASLRAVGAGLLPGPLQVGLTGRAVSPRFYLAVGIRGTLNHMIGVQKAETVVAINNDPAADIFKACDLGVVCDFKELLPPLTHALRAAKQARLGPDVA
ncbi:MAG: electron transfer flavoprotein alpha/ beta subunit [Chloroflexi bacterium]|nr:electron transfer flavoprotein alpha/ beta subunit [Chloroflexota bacterium]